MCATLDGCNILIMFILVRYVDKANEALSPTPDFKDACFHSFRH